MRAQRPADVLGRALPRLGVELRDAKRRLSVAACRIGLGEMQREAADRGAVEMALRKRRGTNEKRATRSDKTAAAAITIHYAPCNQGCVASSPQQCHRGKPENERWDAL